VLRGGSEFIYPGGIAFHEFEDPFLGDFVLQGCLDHVVPYRDGLFETHLRELAIERIPAISSAGGRAVGSGDAPGGIVEVAVIASAEGGRAAGFAGRAGKGAQGNYGLPPE
jgi:hypothetical protein